MRQTLVLLLICTASFMNVLDVTVVSVALPDMGATLGASLSELQWVVNAYTLPLFEEPQVYAVAPHVKGFGTEAVARPSFYSVYFDREEDK